MVRERVEADKELKNRSANDLGGMKIPGITFTERAIYELKYHDETGKDLDIQNITLCSGSRGSVGRVPGVYWFSYCSGMNVNCYGPSRARDCLRAREVVS